MKLKTKLTAVLAICFIAMLSYSCNKRDEVIPEGPEVPQVIYAKDALPTVITLSSDFMEFDDEVNASTNGLGTVYFISTPFRSIIYYYPSQREAGQDIITYEVKTKRGKVKRVGEITVELLGDSEVDDLDDCTRNVGFTDYVRVVQGESVSVDLIANDDFCSDVFAISGIHTYGFNWGSNKHWGPIQRTSGSNWDGANFRSSGTKHFFEYTAPSDFEGRLVALYWTCYGIPSDDPNYDPTDDPEYPHNCEYQSTTLLIVDVVPN